MSELKARINEAVKAAMRAGDKPRLAVLRLITADIKQREVDERVELSDDDVIAVLSKMVKQRRESIAQYEQAGRDELAAQERSEIDVISEFLPQPLTEAEIDTIIDKAIADTGASSIRDMGKVMGAVKPQLQGRADMGAVSGQIKARLES
ncbi:glutamyl-tRNA amidotransferase [Alkalilimnicola ehrlichii]|uniref:Glutamyl-tRNA amidotransferase n=1 Tax=Alkalilimnicola ehrlichii TaxID=351052 RepID=A0A3E0WXF9_9GAMM|nr:GatB/YqeY domain-containing protein [Alkalilimnicola ehrlichii]RFA30140.1 glutamyl-tRNA amidotransferase [Alkalilimnicola ehrlichii]RFA37488.1 glutamyl-tRNA amidotransferase [Alkalilimnicola ehrlichii]